VAGADRHLTPALSQTVQGIGHQVHDDLPDLPIIHFDPRQVRLQIEDQMGFTGNGGLQKSRHVFYDEIEISGRFDDLGLTGVGLHLATKVGSLSGSFHDYTQTISQVFGFVATAK